MGVRSYTVHMTSLKQIPQAPRVPSQRKVVVDCRDLRLEADSLLSWVLSFPQPKTAMHVFLPSSLPQVRRLQCTLQSMGCVVSRVTNCVPSRF